MHAAAIVEHDLTVLHGDVREQLAALPGGSVQCVVTSPPYYGLRDYGTGTWEGGEPECDHAIPLGSSPLNANFNERWGGGSGQRKQETSKVQQFRDVCGKCGATRVDRQIGLEPSPAEYVETMRAVFAQVRRVLATDGVMWLNIGDSYYSGRGNPGPNSDDGKQPARRGWIRPVDRCGQDWAKPKDLLGIPWMVARALQQPQYTGKIRDVSDRAWLAAMLDGEGCIAIHRRMDERRTQPTFSPMVQISNTCLPLLERCKAIAGVGSISFSDRGRNRRIFRYCIMANEARALLRELYTHIIAKRAQARAAIAMPSSGPDAERAWLGVKVLNKGASHQGGWPEPESMVDPGWTLRNAVIWSKPNAMPESVTDRLSTRYEHVFLFSKSRRYAFDLDAIREQHTTALPVVRKGLSRHRFESTKAGSGETDDWGAVGYGDGGRNPGDVWTIPTEPFPGAHFACFPRALARRCIQAGCPEGGTVLDPFAGSGTTLAVARSLGRKSVGIELNADYIDIIRKRIGQTPLDFGEATEPAPELEPAVQPEPAPTLWEAS